MFWQIPHPPSKAGRGVSIAIPPIEFFWQKVYNRGMKFRKELADIIIGLVREGVPVSLICDYVGISEGTLYEWLERGRSGSKVYREFRKAFYEAKVEFVLEALRAIKAAGGGKNFFPYAWLLERRYPEHFGMKKELRLEKGGGVKKVIVEFAGEGDEADKDMDE